MTILSFQEVTKKFSGKIVVEGVSFTIEPSTINVLIGPNGAGKSTIAKLITGIEKATSGKILKKENLSISYVPQNFKLSKDLPITCGDFANSLGVKKQNLVLDLLENMADINELWKQNLGALSSGQMQFFMLSLAFSSKADLIVLDEPTSFLDVDLEKVFYSFIDEFRKKTETAIFLVSHELHTVTNIADQVLCINHHICCSSKPFKSESDIVVNIGIYEHKHDHSHSHKH